MNNTKHTPGPFCTMYDASVIRGFDCTNVATIQPGPRQRANARLIAAAPELLEILRRIWIANDSKNCGIVNGEAVLCRAFADEARAAIAKATGEA